jgi:nucleoid-associated protein YgaU
VLASQGVDAWPVCGPRAGLSSADASGAVSVSGSSSSSSFTTHESTSHHSGTSSSASTESHESTPAVTATSSSTGDYTVKSGDTLSEIATTHDIAGGWEKLYSLNKSVVGSDANLILPGQHLVF